MNTLVLPSGDVRAGVAGRSWRWFAALLTALTLLTAAAAPAAGSTSLSSASEDFANVIVRAAQGGVDSAAAGLARLGGEVTQSLPIISGFAATVPADRVEALEALGSVEAVTPNATLQPLSLTDLGLSTDLSLETLGYSLTNMGALSNVTQIIRAQDAWAAGLTGRGVDVALIDTGVAPVPGLDGAGKVVHGPDLSFDSQDPDFVNIDSYGHGTHMAGIIAGVDDKLARSLKQCKTCLNSSVFSDVTKFVGVAPEARIVNVKVGATDGATDVSQVIAALDWVVQHRNSGDLNIRVVNLSYGTDATQDYTLDPLSYAAEVAWRKGIVVVVSAGNDGTTHGNLANPAYNPRLLAVGASDPNGTLDRSDDTVPDFASRSTTRRNVDVIAPGVSVLGLRVPGSFVDEYNPAGVVGDRFMRGSGTSQSAAVVSGAVALLLERYPHATPDQIKELLRNTAYSLPGSNSAKPDQGRGIVDLSRALQRSLPNGNQNVTAATGVGTLDGARGTLRVYDGDVALEGEIDIFGKPWNGSRWANDAWAGTSWNAGEWNGSRWAGDGWNGSRWATGTWDSDSWAGSRWAGSRWAGSRWAGSRWAGSRWAGSRWAGSRWAGSRWADSMWSSAGWE